MRYLSFAILVTFLGCQSTQERNEATDEKIFHEYLIVLHESLEQNKAQQTVLEFDRIPGDTLRTTQKHGMLLISDTTEEYIALTHGNIFTLDSGQLIEIIRIANQSVELRTIYKDSLVLGILSKEQLLIDQFSEDLINLTRKSILDSLYKHKERGIQKILKKYQISERELNQIIGLHYALRSVD